MDKLHVGIMGCGEISSHYFTSGRDVFSDFYRVVACADLVEAKARARAEQFGVERVLSPEELMADEGVDLIINLTVPKAHEQVILSCLRHGKHVYTEKPLAMSREGIARIAQAAGRAGKRVGSAPDSFMSAPMQTAKKLIEGGWIGDIVGFSATCPMRGNEYHRPDVEFFYEKGAGPILDMAAYYLNVLVFLIGSVVGVNSSGRITWPERTIKVAPRRGERVAVEVPTYTASILEFESGVMGTFVNSFDIWNSKEPNIEIYGEKGTLVLPDPNRYEGEVLISRFQDRNWQPCPQLNEYKRHMRGAGVADMARSINAGTAHRASLELASHVTDVMLCMEESIASGRRVLVESRCAAIPGLWVNEDTILFR